LYILTPLAPALAPALALARNSEQLGQTKNYARSLESKSQDIDERREDRDAKTQRKKKSLRALTGK